MRRRLAAALCLALGAAACGSERSLRLLPDADPITPEIGPQLAEILPDAADLELELLPDAADLELELLPAEGSVASLERLQRGEADLAIVQHNTPYRREVRTVLPLYLAVLHILHERGRSPADASELLQGHTVFAGPEGSMDHWFLTLVAGELGIPVDSYTLVEEGDGPEVVFLFRPVMPSITERIEERYRFFSIGDPGQFGRGAVVEGLSLEYPQLQPFVIPARAYGRANPEAVLTVGVSTLLVAREDLPAHVVYDLMEAVVDHKQELAAVHPSLFHGIRDSFPANELNFPLHVGSRDCLERDEPSVFERYAELAGMSFSVGLALLSGVVAVTRRRDRVRKNRIDSFRIFITLAKDTSEELQRRRARAGS